MAKETYPDGETIPGEEPAMTIKAHSRYSASGAERWFDCPGSVALSEGLPDKSSVWAEEGTHAHEVLEELLMTLILGGSLERRALKFMQTIPRDMLAHASDAARFIYGKYLENPDAEIMVETKIFLSFIHPEMFGTFDGAVIDYFGTLHVFDFKYGAGHAVSVKENLQMIFYAMGLAHLHHWNFSKVRMWIIQPRIKGYDGPTFWEISIAELKAYIPKFIAAVKRVESRTGGYKEGPWCYFCKAKGICPLKQEKRAEDSIEIFARAMGKPLS